MARVSGFDFSEDLFPLDGAGGLGGEIEQHTVDALHLGSDAGRDVLQQVKGYIFHRGSHSVLGIDGADDDAPLIGALALADAHAFQVGDGGEVLPDLALQAVFGELLPQDGIGFTHGL